MPAQGVERPCGGSLDSEDLPQIERSSDQTVIYSSQIPIGVCTT
jgi:hypothetical protein